MINAILGTKIDQAQGFTSKGERIPVTRILAGPCRIVDIKTADKNGHNAVRLGFGGRRISVLTRPELGVFKKAGLEKNPPRFLREVRAGQLGEINDEKFRPGALIDFAEIFKEGDSIRVTGISKGKGFQGVVKRHHFKGGPRTRGQSDRERAPGAIGSTTTPGRVYKGKRMAGRMGNQKVTIKNLKVVAIDKTKSILTISGLVPGGRNSLLLIQKEVA